MNKELFIAVMDRLKEQVPALRWIDAETGQLNVSPRPPVAFPCCLVDMRYVRCRSLTAGAQRIDAQVSLHVAFQACGSTAARGLPYRPASLRSRSASSGIPSAALRRRWTSGLLIHEVSGIPGSTT